MNTSSQGWQRLTRKLNFQGNNKILLVTRYSSVQQIVISHLLVPQAVLSAVATKMMKVHLTPEFMAELQVSSTGSCWNL